MPLDKKTILTRLVEEKQLIKTAQTEPVVNSAAADQEAETIFNQLYDEMMEEVIKLP